jgi:response regulator RpfG family c-di-GMP phosphodiesterase
MSVSEKILLVDDERNMLDAIRREFGDRYQIETALSGQEGLEKLSSHAPFAVIVADYRMPKMDGIQFLNRVMSEAPDTVRMMLSGNADLQAAVDAVNHGQIFRFLTKPCPPELLTQALDDGLRQYRLITSEKELLENTLVESINMLTEVLSIVSPKAYGRSLRVRQLVSFIARRLQPGGAWQYEMAAALSQLGWIIFPPELLDKIELGKPLSASEHLLFSRHPFTARKLLEKIPRLELIARIIENQNCAIDDLCLDENGGEQYFIDLGAHILNVCVDYDRLILQGLSHNEVIDQFYSQTNKYLPSILEALNTLKSAHIEKKVYIIEDVALEDLENGMTIVDMVRDYTGEILVEQNTPVTRALIVQLFRLSSRPGFILKRLKVIRTMDK